MTAEWVGEIAAIALAAILAITLHEAAHGYAARALGDDTAARLGRVSLNPIRHIDLVGTILLPAFLVVSQLLTIGRVEAMAMITNTKVIGCDVDQPMNWEIPLLPPKTRLAFS